MDEPFWAVDPVVRARLQDELLRLQAELHKTVVFVTHDVDEAIRLGDRIAVFRPGGSWRSSTRPSGCSATPANNFVEEFLGRDRGIRRLSFFPAADLGHADALSGEQARSRATPTRPPSGRSSLAAGHRASRAGRSAGRPPRRPEGAGGGTVLADVSLRGRAHVPARHGLAARGTRRAIPPAPSRAVAVDAAAGCSARPATSVSGTPSGTAENPGIEVLRSRQVRPSPQGCGR